MDSCFPAYSAANVFEQIEAGTPRQFSHLLKSENTDGLFDTKAKLVGNYDGKATLALSIDFKGNEDETGLPYNVFAVLATEGQNVASWRDFTDGCTNPPLSVFIGGASPLVKVTTDEQSRAVSFHIVVWGR